MDFDGRNEVNGIDSKPQGFNGKLEYDVVPAPNEKRVKSRRLDSCTGLRIRHVR